jgi:hypothetical protein
MEKQQTPSAPAGNSTADQGKQTLEREMSVSTRMPRVVPEKKGPLPTWNRCNQAAEVDSRRFPPEATNRALSER